MRQGMFATLEPLHAMLERGPQTLKETSFQQAYGRELLEAQDWCRRYKTSGNVRFLFFSILERFFSITTTLLSWTTAMIE